MHPDCTEVSRVTVPRIFTSSSDHHQISRKLPRSSVSAQAEHLAFLKRSLARAPRCKGVELRPSRVVANGCRFAEYCSQWCMLPSCCTWKKDQNDPISEENEPNFDECGLNASEFDLKWSPLRGGLEARIQNIELESLRQQEERELAEAGPAQTLECVVCGFPWNHREPIVKSAHFRGRESTPCNLHELS